MGQKIPFKLLIKTKTTLPVLKNKKRVKWLQNNN